MPLTVNALELSDCQFVHVEVMSLVAPLVYTPRATAWVVAPAAVSDEKFAENEKITDCIFDSSTVGAKSADGGDVDPHATKAAMANPASPAFITVLSRSR